MHMAQEGAGLKKCTAAGLVGALVLSGFNFQLLLLSLVIDLKKTNLQINR